MTVIERTTHPLHRRNVQDRHDHADQRELRRNAKPHEALAAVFAAPGKQIPQPKNQASADRGLAKARAAGYRDARIVREP